MSATYKVKFTRASLDTMWPVQEFYNVIAEVYLTHTPLEHPIGLPWHSFIEVIGFTGYNYEEVDTSIYIPSRTPPTNPSYEHNYNHNLYVNPTSLTLTCLVQFDTWENLSAYITRINAIWSFPDYLTKQDFADWLIVKNQTVEEFFYNDDVLVASPGISAFK